MEADRIPKITRPLSDVLPHYFIDIPTSAAEQSDDVGSPVIPRTRDSPTPIQQMVANDWHLFARRFPCEFDELVKSLHLPHGSKMTLFSIVLRLGRQELILCNSYMSLEMPWFRLTLPRAKPHCM